MNWRSCLGRVTADSNTTNSYFAFSVFSLTWGMCSSLDTNPSRQKNIAFWRTFGTRSAHAFCSYKE